MEDKNYEAAFQLIMNAGHAKSSAMMAIEAARSFKFEEAERFLSEAKTEMHEAHNQQMDMIQAEAEGNIVAVNIILVHAQDHLTMAMMALDHATEFITIYREIAAIKEAIKNL